MMRFARIAAAVAVAAWFCAPAVAETTPEWTGDRPCDWRKASAYEQEGLIAQWDGIDNAGTGVHVANATVWKNLAPCGTNGTLGLTLTSNGSWGDNWLNVSGPSATFLTNTCPPYKTIEIVYRSTENKTVGQVMFCTPSRTHWVVVSANHTSVFFDAYSKGVARPVVKPTFDATKDWRVAAVYGGDEGDVPTGVYTNGCVASSTAEIGQWDNWDDTCIILGDRTIYTSSSDSCPWYGRIYAIRLYSTVLTADQIANHTLLDRARFFNDQEAILKITGGCDTRWTWTQTKKTTVTLTEVVTDGRTPWKFNLTSGGTLSVAAVVDATSTTKVNLRTIPADCPYTIKYTGNSTGYTRSNYFMCNNKWKRTNLSAAGSISSAAGSIIEEIYFPDTLLSVCKYAFDGCTNLVVCDFTENSQLATINMLSFGLCDKLKELRFTERLRTLDTEDTNQGSISGCHKLRIVGPTLPNSVTTIRGQGIVSCPLAILGRLTIGGGDDTDITYYNSPWTQKMFMSCTGITEVVFGAGVTRFYSPYVNTGFSGCTAITNIVCRNPNGFNFYASLSSTLSGLKQFDLYGWPHGTVNGRYSSTRILVPKDQLVWKAFFTDNTKVTPWTKLTETEQNVYWNKFHVTPNGPYTDLAAAKAAATACDILTPKGKVAGAKGTQTYNGATFNYGMWIVADKGDQDVNILTVKCDVDGLSPAQGETATISPAVDATIAMTGTTVTCTAPRYVQNGKILYEVTGFDLLDRNSDGDFNQIVSNKTFSADEARSVTYTVNDWTSDAYQHRWNLSEAKANNIQVNASAVSGLGTVTVTPEPNLCGYYTANTAVTVTATPETGHDFVMWGIAEDAANASRSNSTLNVTVSRALTLYPIFKCDHWDFIRDDEQEGGDTIVGTMTDGAWTFDVEVDTNDWNLTVGAVGETIPYYAYAEELDWSKPIMNAEKLSGEPDDIPLVAVEGLGERIPSAVQGRLRKVSFGSFVESIGAGLFNVTDGTSVSNLEEIVFDSAPTIEGAKAFTQCEALRRIVCRAGVPSATNTTWITGDTDYAVVVTAQTQNASWQAFTNDTTRFTLWANCGPTAQNGFSTFHSGEANPLGMITAKSTGFYLPNQWLQFDSDVIPGSVHSLDIAMPAFRFDGTDHAAGFGIQSAFTSVWDRTVSPPTLLEQGRHYKIDFSGEAIDVGRYDVKLVGIPSGGYGDTTNVYFTVTGEVVEAGVQVAVTDEWKYGTGGTSEHRTEDANLPAGKTLGDTAPNGMKYWHNYVLGVKPATNILGICVQNANSGKQRIEFPAFDPESMPGRSNMAVSYYVQSADSASAETWSDERDAELTVENDRLGFDLGLPEAGVKYYRLQFRFFERRRTDR